MSKRLVQMSGIALVLVLIIFAASPLAGYADFPHDGNPNPTVLPPNSKPHGLSYGEWGAKWWIWATEQPLETNQLFEDGEVDCAVGQTGKVWFLAGSFGGTWTRSCTVPTGTALFFPVGNGLSFAPDFGDTEDEIRADVANDLAGITGLFAYVDGVKMQDLDSYRAASPAFVFPVPEGGLVNQFGFDPGDRFPAVSDGWWLFLAPLPVGEHVIQFGTLGDDENGEPTIVLLDVTYTVTVEPGSRR